MRWSPPATGAVLIKTRAGSILRLKFVIQKRGQSHPSCFQPLQDHSQLSLLIRGTEAECIAVVQVSNCR